MSAAMHAPVVLCVQLYVAVVSNGAFTLGRMSLDKSLHMWLKMVLVMLFSGSVRASHMWSDWSSDMRRRM